MAVLRGAAGWIIRQAAAMQAAAGVRRWRWCAVIGCGVLLLVLAL